MTGMRGIRCRREMHIVAHRHLTPPIVTPANVEEAREMLRELSQRLERRRARHEQGVVVEDRVEDAGPGGDVPSRDIVVREAGAVLVLVLVGDVARDAIESRDRGDEFGPDGRVGVVRANHEQDIRRPLVEILSSTNGGEKVDLLTHEELFIAETLNPHDKGRDYLSLATPLPPLTGRGSVP